MKAVYKKPYYTPHLTLNFPRFDIDVVVERGYGYDPLYLSKTVRTSAEAHEWLKSVKLSTENEPARWFLIE